MTADATDSHSQCNRRGKQVAGLAAVASDPLGDQHADVGSHQATQDAARPKFPGLQQGRVEPDIDMFRPPGQAHADCPADQSSGHRNQRLVIHRTAAAGFGEENHRGHQHAQPDEHAVHRQRQRSYPPVRNHSDSLYGSASNGLVRAEDRDRLTAAPA